jgi:tetratricopeptide (TPR) repeat protein
MSAARRAAALAALLCAGPPVWAAGGSGGILLQQPFGPRPFALGQAYSALGDDAFAMAHNPAALARLRESQAALQMIQGISDVKLGYGVFATPLSPTQAFGAALGYLDAGKIEIYDNSTRLIGTSNLQRDLLVELGYAQGMPLASGRLSLGASAKLLRSHIVEEMSATAYAGSFGLHYERPALGGTGSLALVAANLGPAVKYSGGAATGQSDPLPMSVKAGAGLSRDAFEGDRIAIGLEYTRVFYDDESFPALGVEYTYKNLATLRLGQRFGESLGGLRMGMGLQIKGASIDYALGLMESFNHVHHMSVTYRFFLPGISYRKEAVDGFESFLRRVKDLIAEERYFDAVEELHRLEALAPRRREVLELGANIFQTMQSMLDDSLWSRSVPRRDAYARAFKAYQEPNWKEAASWLAEALKAEPSSEEIPQYLQNARFQADQERKQTDLRQKARIGTLFELANKAYEAGESDRALKIVDEILRLGPYQPAESLGYRITQAKKAPLRRRAPAPRAEAVDAAPRPSAEDVKRAERLYYEGLRLYLENNPETAMEKLSEGLRLDPHNDSLRDSLESIQKGLAAPRGGGRP